MSGVLPVLLAGSMVLGFAAAALAPAPSRPVAGWVQAAVGLIAPASFCAVMALTGAGQRNAGAIAMCVLIASLATLLWLLRAPSGEDGIDEDGGDDDDDRDVTVDEDEEEEAESNMPRERKGRKGMGGEG